MKLLFCCTDFIATLLAMLHIILLQNKPCPLKMSFKAMQSILLLSQFEKQFLDIGELFWIKITNIAFESSIQGHWSFCRKL